MFSGIIEELGEVKNISKKARVFFLEIKADKVLPDTKLGDSIAVNGACLTVVKIEKDVLSFEVIPETMQLTNLNNLRIGQRINLERSLMVGDRISGHFVTGHVDCVGIIRKKSHINNNLSLEIAIPSKFLTYIIPKGSVAVDGISLTLVSKKSNTFNVYIIPHTLKNTTLNFKGPSDKVNIEFDILAKKAASGNYCASN